jgi:hypothetical protein
MLPFVPVKSAFRIVVHYAKSFLDYMATTLPLEVFDMIIDFGRMHGDSGTLVTIPNKMYVILISCKIEMLKRNSELENPPTQ